MKHYANFNSDVRNEILIIVQEHKGKENAISAKNIRKTLLERGFVVGERCVTNLISELCLNYRLPILVTAKKRTGGYFWAESQREIKECIEYFEKYISGLNARIDVLKKYYIK